MKKIITIALIGLLCSISTNAQQINDFSLALMTETMSYPFTRYTPIHPGIEVGINFWEKENAKNSHKINTAFGMYTHKRVENGFYIRGEYVYTQKIKGSVGIDLFGGGGYQHSFYPGTTFSQDETTGHWAKAKQYGKPHALVSFGFGLSYIKSKNIQPFIRHENNIDFALYPGFMNIRTFVKLGLTIKIDNNEN